MNNRIDVLNKLYSRSMEDLVDLQDLIKRDAPPGEPNDEHVEPAPTTNPQHPDVTPQKAYLGDKGAHVELIQERLNSLGYSVDIDGDYGKDTLRKAKEFQKANGLEVDGGFNAKEDWDTLFSDDAKQKPVYKGAAAVAAMADLAEAEAKRRLKWRPLGMGSEAEKYLASIRRPLGMASGRFAWCGAFVFWCGTESGVKLPALIPGTNLTFAYTPAIERWARDEGFWHSARDKSFTPERGDILLFDWDKDANCDHVGIVLSHEPGSNYVRTAEGNTSQQNQSNGDSTAIRKRGWSSIRGFVRISA